MTKFIYRLENSFETEDRGLVPDILASIAFVAALGAGLSWLIV